jgi:uncharacterized membrane protein
MKLTKILLEKSYFLLLLVYSGIMLFAVAYGAQIAFFLTFPLYFLLPGYAFMEVAYPRVTKVEKIIASVGFSIAFLVGLNAFIQTFEIGPLFSELTIVAIVSIIFLIVKLWKKMI